MISPYLYDFWPFLLLIFSPLETADFFMLLKPTGDGYSLLCSKKQHPRHISVKIIAVTRVSFETSFDSKQPKLEPKLVSALSETKRLFRLFRFYTGTASFGVSIEPKQPEDQLKQTETNENERYMKNIQTF
jgi:hypothetical protein